jgi:chromatin structure-remodeling complex subunit RSC1/2
VFHLSESANAAIPEDIREQFHCDDRGHVMFFSSPPLNIAPSSQQKLGHSLKYLAAREERRQRVDAQKRKQAEEQEEREASAKRIRADEETALAARVETLTTKAIETMADQIVAGTSQFYETLYQGQAESTRQADLKARESRVLADRFPHEQTRQIQAHSTKPSFVSLKGNAMYMDEIDPGA